jgi:hypothetical protein
MEKGEVVYVELSRSSEEQWILYTVCKNEDSGFSHFEENLCDYVVDRIGSAVLVALEVIQDPLDYEAIAYASEEVKTDTYDQGVIHTWGEYPGEVEN